MKKPNIPKLYQEIYNQTAAQKVMETLFMFPDKEFSLSDIAREAGVAKANIGAILEKMHSAKLIEITKLNVTWRIRANQQSFDFIKRKVVFNLNLVYQSNLVEFLDDYFRHPKAIVLFGSFRKGDDITDSDIDIAIEISEAEDYRIISLKELEDLEKDIKRNIQIHLFSRKSIDRHVFNNIANGIVVSGFLEANP